MVSIPFKYFFAFLPYSYTFLDFLVLFSPEISILIGVILYFLLFLSRWGRQVHFNFFIFCVVILIVLGVLVFYSPTNFNYQHLLVSFYFTWFLKIVLTVFILLFTVAHYYQIHFAWYHNNKIELDLGSKYFELNIFLLVALLSSFLVISANDFIIFYVNLEILNICFTLICYLVYERTTIEATLKYFFTNIIFSYFILLGICFIYFSFYTFNFVKILQILTDLNFFRNVCVNIDLVTIYVVPNFLDYQTSYVDILNGHIMRKLRWLFIGLFFIFIGLLGKIGLFPGFFWVLDVYGNISVLSNIILSIFPKIIYISLICHLGYCFEIYSYYYPTILFLFLFILSGCLTLLYAVIFTLNQWRIKRFLAGSSLVNLSFLIFIIGFFVTSIDRPLLGIIFFFLVVYLLNLFFVFFLYLLFIQPSNIKLNYYFEDLRDFVQIRFSHKFLSITLALLVLSLIGVPPLIGFYSKLTIFYYLLLKKNFILILIIILANIISCFYYIRAIRFILFSSSKIVGLFTIKYDFKLYFFIILIFLFLFSFVFFSNLILYYLP